MATIDTPTVHDRAARVETIALRIGGGMPASDAVIAQALREIAAALDDLATRTVISTPTLASIRQSGYLDGYAEVAPSADDRDAVRGARCANCARHEQRCRLALAVADGAAALITIQEAATQLGVTEGAVRQAITQGRLQAVANPDAPNPRKGGRLVFADEIRQWANEREAR